jgi:hypothetical protein
MGENTVHHDQDTRPRSFDIAENSVINTKDIAMKGRINTLVMAQILSNPLPVSFRKLPNQPKTVR